MTSIRKIKKWYKSTANKGFKKRFETIHKYPEQHTYIMRHRTFKGVFFYIHNIHKIKKKARWA